MKLTVHITFSNYQSVTQTRHIIISSSQLPKIASLLCQIQIHTIHTKAKRILLFQFKLLLYSFSHQNIYFELRQMSNNQNRASEPLVLSSLQQKQGSDNPGSSQDGRRQDSMVFQQAVDYADTILQQSLLQANCGFPDALSTPGASSSVRLSDTNLNGDDFEQLQELHQMQNVLQSSSTALNTEKGGTDPGNEVLETVPNGHGDVEEQATPRMHPLEYLQADAAKNDVIGEPQEALGEGEGEQQFAQKRELTCIEEEMLDYSPTRSVPSLVAPSQGELARLSQSRRFEGLHGVPPALRGSIRESNQTLNQSQKWPAALAKDKEDALVARPSASNVMMTPNDRVVRAIEEMNLASPDGLNNTDRSNPHDMGPAQKATLQQEPKAGGIQNLLRTYQKPSLQRKMTDLKLITTPGQLAQAASAQQNQGHTSEPKKMQLAVADHSPITRPQTDASYPEDRHDDALKEVMSQFLKKENQYPPGQSLSHREGNATGAETQDGHGLTLNDGIGSAMPAQPSTASTPQGLNPQSQRGSARQTGPQADTKLTQPKKRNKSFNQWRQTQNREKSASASGTAPHKQEETTTRGGHRTELLNQMLSQTKFQLATKRSPEPRPLPTAAAGGAEADNYVTAQFSSNQQTPKEGESGTLSRVMPLSQFHIFQSVGLQDILQRESNASAQTKVAADVFYNNPAQSVIVNVESPSPETRGERAATAKPDAASIVLEPGRSRLKASRLALEKQKTENHRRSRDRERASDTVPDMVFTEGDVRSSAGLRGGALNTQSLTMKAPSQLPANSPPDYAYFGPGQASGPAGIDAQDHSHILKNFSSQVDSDHDEQTDLLNQMLGLPGDHDKGAEALQEPQQNALSERIMGHDDDHRIERGKKKAELRKSQGTVRQKLDLQKQMYFQTTTQANHTEGESGPRGLEEHGLGQSQAELHQEEQNRTLPAGPPAELELQQRISEALCGSQTPTRMSVNKTAIDAKSRVARVLSPQCNNQHVKVIHNRPAVTRSKNTHHHRFGSKTSLGTYHKSAKQESKFEHTTSSQMQQQKTPGTPGGSFLQKDASGLGARKQSAVVQPVRTGDADQFQLNSQKSDQPGPRLHPIGNPPASATISLAAVTASVRSASKENADASQPQLSRKGSRVMANVDPYRHAAQKTILVSEQQLDKYQQEYLERVNRTKQASNPKGTQVPARPTGNQSQSNLRGGGARVRNARSPGTPSTQQASQMEKAVNARRKQLASPTNAGLSSLHQARLSESVLQNSRVDTSAGRYSQSTALPQKQQKMQIEWRQMCKLFDSIPQGMSMKSRYSFSRNDIVSIVSQFRRKIEDLEALVQYEQQKNMKQDRDYNGLLEELKEVKIEKRHYQEQLNRIPDLEIKIEQQSRKLTDCVSFLKRCMVASVVCLEFNKDIQTMMNKFQFGIRTKQDALHNKDKNPIQQQMQNSHWQGVQEVVKAVSELQEQHNLFQAKETPLSAKADYEQSFSVNIDVIEGFINDLIQFQQSHTVYEKVVKVDLENMSSGTDDDDDDDDDAELEGHATQRILSDDDGQQIAGDGARHSEMNYSQHDSEICRIKIKAESMYNYNPSSTNIDNSSAKNTDHYTQLAGKTKMKIDDTASTRIKQSPMTVAPSPLHRGDSAKQRKQHQLTAQSTSKRQLKSFVVANNKINNSVQKPPMVLTTTGGSVASKASKATALGPGADPQSAHPPRPSAVKQGRKSRQSRLHKKAQQAPGDSRQLSSILSVTSPCKSDSKLGSGVPQKPNRLKNLKGPVTEETMRELNKEATGHYEKVMQELQSKKLQYSVLLEKYEHKAKRVMELQDEISKVADLRNEQEIRRQCQEQFGKLEQQYGQLVLKNEGLQQQIRDYQKEIYQQEQAQQNHQQQIHNLNNYIQTQHQLLQDDEKVAELEKAVITLCNNQLAQKFENISSKDKQILQAVFGDGFLIQNQMRADLVRAREVAQFLLNDVAIQIFDFFEKLDRNAAPKNAVGASQVVRLGNLQNQEPGQPQQSLYYEKVSNNDTLSLAPSLLDQQQVYQTHARKGRGGKLIPPESSTGESVPKATSQHRQSSNPAAPLLGFVNQLNQKKGKNMEADLNFNLFNDHEADDSPAKLAHSTVEEPRAARSAAKRPGFGQQSPRDNAAMTNRSNRSMNTIKSGERKSLNTRRSSQVGGRAGGNLSAQAALIRRMGLQNKFLDGIKSQLQVMYDRHEAFNDFILSDPARESLLRHISVAARKPADGGGDTGMSLADRRPRSTEREDDSIIDTSVNLQSKAIEPAAPRGLNQRRVDAVNWARSGPKAAYDPDPRPRNTQMAYLGTQIESLTGGVDAQADFITERQDFDESMALPQSSSRLDLHSHQINTSHIQDESQVYPAVQRDAERLRQWPTQNRRQMSATDFP